MFRAKCPICAGLLTIDPRTRKIVSHLTREQAAQKPVERLESLIDKVQKSKDNQESRLEAAKQRETDRKKRLEELFKDAQEKTQQSEDEGKPRGPVW
jgi:vacuolar-type H+-ATPase subunit I/STV1